MQRLVLVMILVVASLAMPVPSHAEDASDVFLAAYQDFQNADKLVGEGSLREALAKYEAVQEALLKISQEAPDWQPLVVEYRLKKTQENIARLQSEVADLPPPTEAIEGELPREDRSTGAGPVVSTAPVISSRPPPGVRSTARTTPTRRSTNTVEGQLNDLRDQLAQARSENERLNARLQSALVEVDKTKVTVVDLKSQLAQANVTLENAKRDGDDFSAIRAEFDKKVVGILQKLTDAEADREVLREENARLFAKLERAATYIASSDGIREDLLEERTKLAEARDKALFQVEEAREASLKSEVLAQENEKLKEELAAVPKEVVSKAEFERLTAENASLSEALAAAEERVTMEEHGNLIAAKKALENELAEAQTALEQAKAAPDPERDAMVANLQSDLNSVKDRYLEAQAQISRSDEQMATLKKQLDDASREMAELRLNPSPSHEDKQLMSENDLLRGIILRQIKGQAMRDEAKRELEKEIGAMQVESETIAQQIQVLGAPVLELTEEEQKLFKEPVALLNEPDAETLNVTMAVVKPSEVAAAEGALTDPSGTKTSGLQGGGEDIPEDVREMVAQAKALFEQKQYEETEKMYQDIVERVPENYFALSNLAAVQIEAGKLAAAEVALKKAVEINDQDSFAFTNLGILYSRQGRFDEAIEALNKALVLNDGDAVAHNYLGVCLGQKDQREDAEQQFKRAIEINGDYPDAHFNLAVLYATTQPRLMELAKHYYIKATELGAAPDPSLENLIQ